MQNLTGHTHKPTCILPNSTIMSSTWENLNFYIPNISPQAAQTHQGTHVYSDFRPSTPPEVNEPTKKRAFSSLPGKIIAIISQISGTIEPCGVFSQRFFCPGWRFQELPETIRCSQKQFVHHPVSVARWGKIIFCGKKGDKYALNSCIWCFCNLSQGHLPEVWICINIVRVEFAHGPLEPEKHMLFLFGLEIWHQPKHCVFFF